MAETSTEVKKDTELLESQLELESVDSGYFLCANCEIRHPFLRQFAAQITVPLSESSCEAEVGSGAVAECSSSNSTEKSAELKPTESRTVCFSTAPMSVSTVQKSVSHLKGVFLSEKWLEEVCECDTCNALLKTHAIDSDINELKRVHFDKDSANAKFTYDLNHTDAEVYSVPLQPEFDVTAMAEAAESRKLREMPRNEAVEYAIGVRLGIDGMKHVLKRKLSDMLSTTDSQSHTSALEGVRQSGGGTVAVLTTDDMNEMLSAVNAKIFARRKRRKKG